MSNLPNDLITKCRQKLLDAKAELLNRVKEARMDLHTSEDRGGDEGDQTMVVSKEQLLAKLKPAAGSGGAEGADGEPDDLKQIRGIGPAIEKRLHEQGIVTVAQIASLDDDACEGLAAAIKVSADKIRRDQWVEQARSLQAGS